VEKIAIYGKGGIGKSVVATALSAHFGMRGKRVLHMGCDPKHDSAIRLIDGQDSIRTVLDVLGDNPAAVGTREILTPGRHGIHCCEAGGPPAGLGCGGRGVARAIELMDEMELLESGEYDVAIFDVLGDVVCGGFAAPLRDRFAEKVVIVMSEEPMALFAANNIARAVVTYQKNGVGLAGLVINQRAASIDLAGLERFAQRLNTRVLTRMEREPRIQEAERHRRTIVEFCPDCPSARALTELARALEAVKPTDLPLPTPMEDSEFFHFMATMGA